MTPALSIRRPVILGLAAALALVVGFGLWATLTHISGAIVAQGQIEVERDRQVVQHPDGGVVAEILVEEGARVEAGQMLLRLDGAALRSELTIVEGQLSELAGRSARLTAERDGLTSLEFPADILALAETSKEVAAQLDGQRRLFEDSPVAIGLSDGGRVVTASGDRTARVWSTRTGQPMSEPLRHEDLVYVSMFTPDDSRVMTAGGDGWVRLWPAPRPPRIAPGWLPELAERMAALRGGTGTGFPGAAAAAGCDLALVSCCLQKIDEEERAALSRAGEGLSLRRETLGLSNLTSQAKGVETTIEKTMAARQARHALLRPMISSWNCQTGTTPSSAHPAFYCRADNGSGSPSGGPSCANRRPSCSTNRCRTSTRRCGSACGRRSANCTSR